MSLNYVCEASFIRKIPDPRVIKKDKVVYGGDDRPTLVEAQRSANLCFVRRNALLHETARYNDIVNNTHPPYEVAARKFNTHLLYRDLETLAPKKWLNDDVVDFYLRLVEEMVRSPYNDFHIFNPQFWQILNSTAKTVDGVEQCDYEKVKHWTNKVVPGWFQRRLVLIPVNVNGCHWTLVVVHNKKLKDGRMEHEIMYYDSCHGPLPKRQLLVSYLKVG